MSSVAGDPCRGAPTLACMRARSFDPRRLDVASFCRDGGVLEGEAPLSGMPRLAESMHSDAGRADTGPVRWHLRGETRSPAAGPPQPWLQVQAEVELPLVCQRCLGPIGVQVLADRWFRFERDETRASELDAQVEEDVLALGGRFDALELVEDELLLSLPLVPRHDACPSPLRARHDVAEPATEAAADPGRPNPFAALAGLRRAAGGKTPGKDEGGADD